MGMTSADPRKPKCAFCKRWSGDAKVTNQGISNGLLRFEVSARGNCMARSAHVAKNAGDGASCKDYVISPEASRFI